MPAAPTPPSTVQTIEDLVHQVNHDPTAWFQYIEALIAHCEEQGEESALARVRIGELEKYLSTSKDESSRQTGVIAYQKNMLEELNRANYKLEAEKNHALSLATPAVSTPRTDPVVGIAHAEPRLDTAKGETPLTPAASTPSARLSERLPDPKPFEGDRKDYRRFASKIHEKMKTNRDRFPTARERMSYVTNRLEGTAYAQVLPYILDGECQLNDYPDVLRVLDHAFGDPNRVNTARKQLFGLRQTNQEFGTFYAEFQRLALEGEVTEDSQYTLLENSLSRELKAQLVNIDLPEQNVHDFALFLQKLENRRRYYDNLEGIRTARPMTTVTRTATTKPFQAPRPSTPVSYSSAVKTEQIVDPNAMDLAKQRRSPPPTGSTRKERGECFRCGSREHRVRECPRPDNRPQTIRQQEDRPASPPSPNYSIAYSDNRSASPDTMSLNGVSLGTVAPRLNRRA